MLIGRVLIVDDAPAILRLLRQSLEKLGIDGSQISEASNLRDATKIFREEQPPVVFLDVAVGDGHGEKFAQKALEFAPETKIIMMTGLNPDDSRVRDAISFGAYELIQKPLRIARLREVLELIEAEEKGLRRH